MSSFSMKYSDEFVQNLVRLRDDNGLTFVEIAARLEAPVSSVKDLHRRFHERATKVKQPHSKIKGPDEVDPKTGIGTKEGTNEKTLISRHPMISTVQQLLDYCEVDQEIWKVEHYEVNAWPGWRSRKEVDLVWTGGSAEGYVRDHGDIALEQLVQVKAWLVRISPIAIFPHIQPIKSNLTFERPEITVEGNLSQSLVIADLHVGFRRDSDTFNQLYPFHDRRCMDLILKLALLIKPDRIDIIGDKLDLPDWTNRFVRSPDMTMITQPALIELHWWLNKLRSLLPNADINVLEGNHEKRMRDAIATHLPAAYGLKPATKLEAFPTLSVPNLLGLEELGINWVEGYPTEGGTWLGDGIEEEHGTMARKSPGATAGAMVRDRETSSIFGHIHRPELASKMMRTRAGLRPVQSICPGCACLVDGSVPGHNPRNQDWIQGVAIVWFNELATTYDVNLITIHDGIAVYDGALIYGEDPIEELRESYPDWGF